MRELPDLSTQPRERGGSLRELLLLGACGVLLALAAYSAWRARSERTQAEFRVAFVRSESARLRAATREPRQREGRIRGGLVAPLLLSIDAPPTRVASVLAARLPARARIGTLVLRYADVLWVDMEVHARDAAAYDRLVESLLEAPEFEELLPGAELREGEIRSSLSARFVPGAP